MSIFSKLFLGASKPATGIEAEFAEFKETFHLKPNVLFMDYLKEERVTNLVEWFDPASDYPEPKAFIRMINDTTRRGVNIWDQTGITMNLESGLPAQHSQECLSVLAQILGFPLTTYYRETPDSDLQKLIFEP